MKANEFVLEHGWDAAKRLVENNKHTGRTLSPSELELKRLVESHELVKFIGNDLNGAKQVYGFTKNSVTIDISGRIVPVVVLKQAIADVEICQ